MKKIFMTTVLVSAMMAAQSGAASGGAKEEYMPSVDTKRSDVPDEFKWDLTPLFKNLEQWNKEFAAVEKEIPDLDQFKGTLAQGKAQVKACLDKTQELNHRADKLGQYAFQLWSTDRNAGEAQALYERSEFLISKLVAQVSFIEPELLSLDAKTLEALSTDPDLVLYDHYLDDLIRRQKHVLDKSGEGVLALLRSLSGTPYTVLNSLQAEMPFPEITDEEGKKVQLGFANFPKYRSSSKREVRKEAVEALFATLKKFSKSYAASLSMKIKADVYIAQAMGYPSALAASLDDDAVTPEMYKKILDVTAENLPRTLHRYVKLKKDLLGLDSVHYYDLYAPMYEDDSQNYPYSKAQELTLEAMKPMGEEYLKPLAEGLDLKSGWADVYPNEGKRSGAYCTSVHGYHPYVLLNHMNTLDEVFTAAHEFGHALHSWFSGKNQPISKADYPIILAEIASTFQEAMLLKHLMETTDDITMQKALLANQLEKIRLTIFRQLMFAEYEMLIHEEVEKGGALTADRFSELYVNLVKKYYGPDFVVDENDGMEWAYIPHFYYNFYVYKYATGLMAAFAFSEKILAGEEGVKEKYLGFLKSGGSDYPLNILTKAGIDLMDPEMLEQTYDVFERTVKRLESLKD